MKRRLLSICMALALCLTLLPATAWAASGTQQIYVGNERLDSYNGSPAYATTDASGNVSTDGANEGNYNVKWDGTTLTLKDAYVINRNDGSLEPFLGSGIYEAYSIGDIEIALVGTNVVAGNCYGIYTEDHDLTFSGSGSLAVVCMDNLDGESGINARSVTVESGSLTIRTSGHVPGMNVGELNVNGGSVNIAAGGFGVNISERSNTLRSVNIYGGELTVTGSPVIMGGSFNVNGSENKTIVVELRTNSGDSLTHHISSQVTLTMGHTGGEYPAPQSNYFHSYVGGELATANSVSLDKDELSLYEGDTEQLTATVEPEETPVTWTSSNPIVATVDAEGHITARSEGETTITASAGKASASCTVTVRHPEYNIVISGAELYGDGSKGIVAYATTDASGMVSTENASETNYHIKWDGETLTLRDATVQRDEDSAIQCLNGSGEVKIQIEGVNTVKGAQCGIDHCTWEHRGPITIDGSGTLRVIGGAYGIRTDGLTINGGDITAESGDTGIDSAGNVTITGGTVNASAEGPTAHGIYARGSVTITGGTVTATGNGTNYVAQGSAANGIYSSGSVTISGGTVTATGTSASSNGVGAGIRGVSGVTITGDIVTAVGSTQGVYAGSSEIKVSPPSGGSISVKAGDGADTAAEIAGSPFTEESSIKSALTNKKYFHSDTPPRRSQA